MCKQRNNLETNGTGQSATSVTRVDHERVDDALIAADFITARHDRAGEYTVADHWGPEGEIYRALCIWALLDASRFSGNEKYVETSKDILTRFAKRQRSSGGWALSLGSDGRRFKITDEERRDSEELEDPVIVGAYLRAESEYRALTGDERFRETSDRAFEYVCSLWDHQTGTIRERRDRHLSALRSNPEAYHFLILAGLQALDWSIYPKAKDLADASARFVATVFESFDVTTMPLMVGYHIAILLNVCSAEYVVDVIKPKLETYLAARRFRSSKVPGGYGHRDGARGIVTEELHMRSAAGLAMAMRGYDHKTGTIHFTRMYDYTEIASWIDGMKSSEGGYYEVQDEIDGQRFGKGAGGQYLPVFWILGTI